MRDISSATCNGTNVSQTSCRESIEQHDTCYIACYVLAATCFGERLLLTGLWNMFQGQFASTLPQSSILRRVITVQGVVSCRGVCRLDFHHSLGFCLHCFPGKTLAKGADNFPASVAGNGAKGIQSTLWFYRQLKYRLWSHRCVTYSSTHSATAVSVSINSLRLL